MKNPFHYGNAVIPSEFIEPDINIMWTIAERITNNGGATAIIGESRFGKTSLLKYLYSPSIVYGINQVNEWKHLFQFVDAHMFLGAHNQKTFWQYALGPIATYSKQSNITPCIEAYQECVSSDFDVIDIENLFLIMEKLKIRLVLLIDEFDDFLEHPVFGESNFSRKFENSV